MSRRRIVHLGLGNFHRAHQAVYTAAASDAADWDVTGVAHRSATIVQALRRQQMRYAVVTVDDSDRSVLPVRVHDEALVAASDSGAVIARIAEPGTAIVSLTVTEKGYTLRPDGQLSLDDDGIRDDLAGGPPRTTVGLLAAGLLARAHSGAGPLTVLCCDNLTDNGPTVRSALVAYADAIGGSDGRALLSTVDSATFPRTMVDRIVPATTDEHREMARTAGIDDDVPVPAEPFSMWVMEDSFAAGRPGWDATFSDAVEAYENVKVRLLNGTHSLLAGLGLLAGLPTIATATDDTAIDRAAELIGDEYEPTLRLPAGFDVREYRSQLHRRWANHALAHSVRQVGTDTSLKLTQRLPAAVRWHHDRGRTPPMLALTAAAWLQGQGRPDRLAGGVTPPPDPAATRLQALASAVPTGAALATAALVEEQLLGPVIAGVGPYVELVGELIDVLDAHGVTVAIDVATTR